MPYKKGAIPGPGRPKGLENQKTRDIKEVVSQVIDYMGDPVAMRERLKRIDDDNPSTLLKFLASVCPKDLKISGAMPYVIIELPAKEVEKERYSEE